MHRGHSESVSRGHPSGGLVFWYDLSNGLSDHLGVKEGFWRIWLSLSNTVQAAPAATVNAFSAYLIGLCISSLFRSSYRYSQKITANGHDSVSVARCSSIVQPTSGDYLNELSCFFSCLYGDSRRSNGCFWHPTGWAITP